jgi:hypothetical protein
MKRATLYLRNGGSDVALIEMKEGEWERHAPQQIPTDPTNDPLTKDQYLSAFTVGRLGAFSLTVPERHSDFFGFRDVYRGLLPWVSSVLALFIGWMTSRFAHKTEERRRQ